MIMANNSVFAAAVIALLVLTAPAFGDTAPAFVDDDGNIRQQIIQSSINDYRATGHPCACPYNTARNGSRCGDRSAYSRPGGAAPVCYPKDITDQMVTDWKTQHGKNKL
jgi:hypothetical protein